MSGDAVARVAEGEGLRLLLVVLLGRRARVVLHFVDALLELLDAGAERAGEIGQALGAEEDEDDDEDQQQLLVAQTKHGGTPFLVPDATHPTRHTTQCQRATPNWDAPYTPKGCALRSNVSERRAPGPRGCPPEPQPSLGRWAAAAGPRR